MTFWPIFAACLYGAGAVLFLGAFAVCWLLYGRPSVIEGIVAALMLVLPAVNLICALWAWGVLIMRLDVIVLRRP